MSSSNSRQRRAVRALAPLAIAAVAALLAAGCGGSKQLSTDQVEQVSPGTIARADAIPAPAGDTVLTLTGFGARNAADGLELSLADLEQMRTVKADIYEPFLKRRAVFQGVALQDLVNLAQLPDGTQSIYSVAYNEYAVTLPTSILRHPGVILATRQDGKPIPLDEGGPTRVVFTDDHPDMKNESLWIWSTKTLQAR